jgi:hypothetical protein
MNISLKKPKVRSNFLFAITAIKNEKKIKELLQNLYYIDQCA